MATAHKIALKLAERRGWYCHWCGKTLDKKSVTADHIIPKSKGGKNTIENIVPSCQRCNNIRGDRQDITKLEKEKSNYSTHQTLSKFRHNSRHEGSFHKSKRQNRGNR